MLNLDLKARHFTGFLAGVVLSVMVALVLYPFVAGLNQKLGQQAATESALKEKIVDMADRMTRLEQNDQATASNISAIKSAIFRIEERLEMPPSRNLNYRSRMPDALLSTRAGVGGDVDGG